MLPNFLIEETTVRESGEGPVFDIGENTEQNLILTFGITHAIEQESMAVEIFGSKDRLRWSPQPILSFPPKCYCGTYQMILRPSEARYLKAVWRVNRWARADCRPFFRFYLFAQLARARAMAGAA
jgi:hypothetical protein